MATDVDGLRIFAIAGLGDDDILRTRLRPCRTGWNRHITRSPRRENHPRVARVVATAEPAIAAIAAAIMLSQALEPVQWLGVGIVVVAISTVQRLGLTDAHPTSPIA